MQRTEIHTTEFKTCVCVRGRVYVRPRARYQLFTSENRFFAFHSKSAATELRHISVLPAAQVMQPVAYTSGIQPGLRVPPGVREDILGGT
jgi:hypothetical protein